MTNLPPLKALSAFEAAFRNGGFVRAGEELHVTPSAVSHQIKLLEDVLGVSLFERLDRGVEPTAAARSYYEDVATAFRTLETGTHRLRTKNESQVLRVHSAPSFANQWLMPHLSEWMKTHPDIDLKVQVSHGPANPAADDVDIDIRYGRYPAPQMQVLPIARERVVPMCAPSLLPAGRRLTSVADLTRLRPIRSEKCLVQWEDWTTRHADSHFDLPQGPRFDRSYMAIRSAVDGLGVCLDSTLLAYDELAKGRLVMPLGPEPSVELIGHFMVVARDKAECEPISTFKQWLAVLLTRYTRHFDPQMVPLSKEAPEPSTH